jgi:hypothetical protein
MSNSALFGRWPFGERGSGHELWTVVWPRFSYLLIDFLVIFAILGEISPEFILSVGLTFSIVTVGSFALLKVKH